MEVLSSNKLIFLFLVTILIWNCSSNSPASLHNQNNAIWAESIYLRGYNPTTRIRLTSEKLHQWVTTLRNHNIKYVYLFAGPYDSHGHLPSYSMSEEAINNIKLIKSYAPELIVLPWVGGIQNKTVKLEDSSWVSNAVIDSKKLVQTLGVPGLHVDFEYILKGEPYLDTTTIVEKYDDMRNYGSNVNLFHEKLRGALPRAFISSVVVSTSKDTRPWKRKTSMLELQSLVKNVDQLSFLYYDTNINSRSVFEKNYKYLIEDILVLKRTRDIQYLIGIGTFTNVVELQHYRNIFIESIPNTLGLITKYNRSIKNGKKVVDGISIFCDWQTQADEWEQIDKYWTKK